MHILVILIFRVGAPAQVLDPIIQMIAIQVTTNAAIGRAAKGFANEPMDVDFMRAVAASIQLNCKIAFSAERLLRKLKPLIIADRSDIRGHVVRPARDGSPLNHGAPPMEWLIGLLVFVAVTAAVYALGVGLMRRTKLD